MRGCAASEHASLSEHESAKTGECGQPSLAPVWPVVASSARLVISFAHGDAACRHQRRPIRGCDRRVGFAGLERSGDVTSGSRRTHRVVMCDFDTHTARMDLTFSLAERWSEAGEPPGSAGRWSFAPTCSMRPASKR
jgi:hypothetical protein